MKPIDIFKAGKHTAMSGAAIDFAEAHLHDVALAYDPSLHEAPLVIGHPKHDAPAYGWVDRLDVSGGHLIATPKQVHENFAEMVKQGSFKKISASFYVPSSPANPMPGKFYLRHVAFLGAQPPAIKGLAPVDFGDGDDGGVTFELDFAEPGRLASLTRSIVILFRRQRERLITESGLDAAETTLPSWEIDNLSFLADRLENEAEAGIGSPSPAFAEQETSSMNIEAQRLAELDAREAALAAREKDIGARELSFSEQAVQARRADDRRFLDAMAAEGKIVPALVAPVLDFMAKLDGDDTVDFGEGPDAVAQTAHAFFRGLIEKSGAVIDFSERAAGGGQTLDFADGSAIAAEIAVVMGKARADGREISPVDALAILKKKG